MPDCFLFFLCSNIASLSAGLLMYCRFSKLNFNNFFQDRCGVVNANGGSPLETMRGLEHYLNDIMRPPPDSTDVKGQFFHIIHI